DPFDVVFDMGNDQPVKKVLFDRPKIEVSNAIKEELSTFHDAIVNDTRPIVSLEDGYKALDVAQKIMDELNQSASIYTENNI
ncbi:MAG: gfo/Idh/MocA family oxidoreductase, partial [Crocinitomicaceae bacterium]